MDMEVRARAVIYAALPGEALLSGEGRASAARLAAALFSQGAPDAGNPCCNICRGTYFEFRSAGRVYCLLCGASGPVSSEGDGIRLELEAPVHSWRGPAARKAHGEWLVGMKEKYRRERERLKSVTIRHAGGHFI
jgi:hypothetical protein